MPKVRIMTAHERPRPLFTRPLGWTAGCGPGLPLCSGSPHGSPGGDGSTLAGAPVPDDTTLLRWANLIEPATLAALNERVVELARSLQVTRGRKLRVDSTVVETTLHHPNPTDSGLLGDGVRVLSRLLRRAKAVVGQTAPLGPQVFRRRVRSVRRLLRQLHRLARHKGEVATAQTVAGRLACSVSRAA
jgi:transposase, IS5 family